MPAEEFTTKKTNSISIAYAALWTTEVRIDQRLFSAVAPLDSISYNGASPEKSVIGVDQRHRGDF
jgi:hypothetical protein